MYDITTSKGKGKASERCVEEMVGMEEKRLYKSGPEPGGEGVHNSLPLS